MHDSIPLILAGPRLPRHPIALQFSKIILFSQHDYELSRLMEITSATISCKCKSHHPRYKNNIEPRIFFLVLYYALCIIFSKNPYG
jgi:hypothetical protein